MKYFFNRQVFSTHILIIISYITKDDDNLGDGLMVELMKGTSKILEFIELDS